MPRCNAPSPNECCPYLIRPALPEDAAGIAGLLHDIGWFQAYESHSASENTQAVQALLDELQAGPDRSLMLVAQDAQQRIHGYCAVHWLPVAVQQGWEAYVSELFVAEGRAAPAWASSCWMPPHRLRASAQHTHLAGQQPRAPFLCARLLFPPGLERAGRNGALCAPL
jgi:hypothetical protein